MYLWGYKNMQYHTRTISYRTRTDSYHTHRYRIATGTLTRQRFRLLDTRQVICRHCGGSESDKSWVKTDYVFDWSRLFTGMKDTERWEH